MGEMTIRLDDAVLVQLRQRAERLGTDVEQLAADIVQGAFGAAPSVPASNSSNHALDRLRLIRRSGRGLPPFDATASIREDRTRR